MPTSRALVQSLGPHPITTLDLDPSDDAGLWEWLVAACLLAAPEARALAAFRELASRGEVARDRLTNCEPEALALRLGGAGLTRPERFAQTLVRAARALDARHDGSLTGLVAAAGDLSGLGEALVGLAPGLGVGTALRFLRPLRAQIAGGDEIPLAASALAAAFCLDWVPADADPEGAPGLLARRVREEPDAPPLADVEAALERLGAASCRKGRTGRCPLALACALRYRQEP